jgi:hypothetical protein
VIATGKLDPADPNARSIKTPGDALDKETTWLIEHPQGAGAANGQAGSP